MFLGTVISAYLLLFFVDWHGPATFVTCSMALIGVGMGMATLSAATNMMLDELDGIPGGFFKIERASLITSRPLRFTRAAVVVTQSGNTVKISAVKRPRFGFYSEPELISSERSFDALDENDIEEAWEYREHVAKLVNEFLNPPKPDPIDEPKYIEAEVLAKRLKQGV